MPVEIVHCDQNGPDWLKARMGIPTASAFATVMANGRGGAESKTRSAYMRKLAGEIITEEPMATFGNATTERGHAMEPEARNFYAFATDHKPELVGFIRNGQKGGSPDALIGNDGLLEIKTAEAHVLIEYLQADKFPAEHVAQCQGNLLVSEREWIDIIVYWPKLPPLIKRAYRDESYIAKMSEAIEQFNDELSMLVERIRRYGQTPEARMERVSNLLAAG